MKQFSKCCTSSLLKEKWTRARGQIGSQEEWKLEFYCGPSIRPVLSQFSLTWSDSEKSAWTSTAVVFTYCFLLYARSRHQTTHANKHQSDKSRVNEMLKVASVLGKAKAQENFSLYIFPLPIHSRPPKPEDFLISTQTKNSTGMQLYEHNTGVIFTYGIGFATALPLLVKIPHIYQTILQLFQRPNLFAFPFSSHLNSRLAENCTSLWNN